ncbi:MAG: SURF1 family protein [Antricoccus sp.]
MYRFLFSARWIAGFFVAVLAILIMLGLSRWQWDRLHDKRTTNSQIRASTTAPVVPAGTLMPIAPSDSPKSTVEWSRVSVTGIYLTEDTVLIRGGTNADSTVGFDVVVPLKATDGRIYLIDRGFVAAPDVADQLPKLPDTPSGTVTVTGRVRVESPASNSATSIQLLKGVRTVRALDNVKLANDLSLDLSGGYIAAIKESTASGDAVAKIERIPVPELDEGPYLSYAIQWILFAGMGIGAFVVMVRREKLNQLLLDDEAWDDDWDDEDGVDGEPDDRSPAMSGPTT